MSYYIRIFCRSDASIPVGKIMSFIQDGVYFDSAPEFECDVDKSGDAWQRLIIRYDQAKRPIVVENSDFKPMIREELDELRDAVQLLSINRDRILTHLDNTRRIVTFDVNPVGLTDDAWQMLDCLEAFIASQYGGIVYAAGDGFYDEALQPIAKVQR